METVGALGAAAPILGSISNLSGCAGWSWVGCGYQKDLISDQIPTCLVPRISGIKIQLLCGVRIELAWEVGSLFVSQDWPRLQSVFRGPDIGHYHLYLPQMYG